MRARDLAEQPGSERGTTRANKEVTLRAAIAATAVSLAAFGAAERGAAAPPHAVSIFAPRGAGGNCARVLPLKRVVSAPALLQGAMRALLAGPTKAERALGYGGWFSSKTAGHLQHVRVSYGTAFVDFRSFARDIPNASSSCGSALLLAQLDRTAKQFPTVRRTVYSFGGSVPAFYQWLQRAAPEQHR